MNIEADIRWIREELINVKDPNLIEAFKNMLKYRKEKQALISEELELSLGRALSDKEAGRVKPHNKIRPKYEKWL